MTSYADPPHDAPASESPVLPAELPLPAQAGPHAKKGKGKKAADADDPQKQIVARLAQLEQDAAGNKEEEAEIEREVRKATRDLSHHVTTIDAPMAKVDFLLKRSSELNTNMERTKRELAKAKKRGDQVQKEKDAQKIELNKANQKKSALENLSRTLDKENKQLKEDLANLKNISADRSDELHDRLEKMVLDVSAVINDGQNPDVFVEMDEDRLFREKFVSFAEQYEMREIQFASLLRSKELEIQYHLARFDSQKNEHKAELQKSNQLTRQVSTFSQTETELRSQLNIYVEKFKQVEDTLNNSNDLFLTFRKEMEEMSKKTKRLEKENMQLTRKQELTNHNILQMAEERTTQQKTMDALTRENEKLKKLCRAMQSTGYGQAVDMRGGVAPEGELQEGDEGVTDSEYEEDYDDDEEGSMEGEYDEDTEEEQIEARPKTFGPPPPPEPPQQPLPLPNGKTNGQVNGLVHGKKVNGVRH
ncbi:hypothetical protein B0A49_06140 [Cryomyces minteri]|uniref:Alpha-taxilin n=1 Tax=Cryomyces minteri TaxID=331657 RepID=A0A4U0X9V2_9PEZI|nr:hypothetical protein B0A49_06140 [Cryomyces minteri]